MSEIQRRRPRNRQAAEKHSPVHWRDTTGPLKTPRMEPSHGTPRNAILEGVLGAAPDLRVFRQYMISRGRKGHIPTLLKDWITAHANYQSEAREQVRDWIEENRHLFKEERRKQPWAAG